MCVSRGVLCFSVSRVQHLLDAEGSENPCLQAEELNHVLNWVRVLSVKPQGCSRGEKCDAAFHRVVTFVSFKPLKASHASTL